MWKVTYSDNTYDIFTDSTLEMVAASVDDNKVVVKVENMEYVYH